MHIQMNSYHNKEKLILSNVSKSYNNTLVLEDINIKVNEGELVTILGPSGSGKSTIFNIITNLTQKDNGNVYIDGKISYMQQKDLLLPYKTIIDNVSLPLILNKENKKNAQEIVRPYFKEFGLEGYEDKYPSELSGGMKQRVMIAIALVGSPSIVIADEPTTSLDVTIEAQILDVLKNLQKTLGTSIILITHDLGVIAKLCDRVLVMYGGKIVERGSVDEIFYDTAHPYTKGLMHSIAKLDTAKGHKLQPIEGTPPDLFAPPKGCPFAARCEYCMEICKDMPPQTYELSKEHETCCWLQHEYAPDTDMRRKVTEKGEV